MGRLLWKIIHQCSKEYITPVLGGIYVKRVCMGRLLRKIKHERRLISQHQKEGASYLWLPTYRVTR